jgi:hypothetical protein
MTSDLIVRLAARCAGKELPPDMVAAEKRKFLHRIGITSAQLANWLEQLKRDSKWLDEMLAIEAAYGKHCDTLLVPEARQRELLALRLPLTRFETETVEVESLDAAREALFCVREDGMSMEEVATEGGYPYRRTDFILEDLPVDAQHRFLSVSAGEVLKPLAHADGFELCRILKKIEPQPDDPNVKSRIDQGSLIDISPNLPANIRTDGSVPFPLLLQNEVETAKFCGAHPFPLSPMSILARLSRFAGRTLRSAA